jgi:hypothetical protein
LFFALFVFVLLFVYQILPVSLDCPLSPLSGFSNVYVHCLAFNLQIACARCSSPRHSIRMAFNSGTDNLCIFCVLNKKSSLGFARIFHVFKHDHLET